MPTEELEKQEDGVAAAIARIVVFVVVTVVSALAMSIVPMAYSRIIIGSPFSSDVTAREASEVVSTMYAGIGFIALLIGGVVALIGPTWWNRSAQREFESLAELKAHSKTPDEN